MRRFQVALLATVAVVGFASIATAADMPVKAPVYKAPAALAPADNWTGFYIGGTIGGMAATSDRSSSANPLFWSGFGPDTISTLNSTGSAKLKGTAFVGGVQAGYNWQTGPYVVGIEADFNSSRMNANSDTGILPPPPLSPGLGTYRFAYSVHTDWVVTLRGRVGWSLEKSLIYVTGGAAWTRVSQTGHVEFDSVCGGPSPGCDSDVAASITKTGWALGAGVEYKLDSHWSIKGEYIHLDFGSMSANMPNLGFGYAGSSFAQSINLKEDILRLGGNYKF